MTVKLDKKTVQYKEIETVHPFLCGAAHQLVNRLTFDRPKPQFRGILGESQICFQHFLDTLRLNCLSRDGKVAAFSLFLWINIQNQRLTVTELLSERNEDQ